MIKGFIATQGNQHLGREPLPSGNRTQPIVAHRIKQVRQHFVGRHRDLARHQCIPLALPLAGGYAMFTVNSGDAPPCDR